jgi:hypothetical protein
MFKRRKWPLLLLSTLSLLSFGGFAAFVWFEPLGDPRVGTYGPSASTQLPEATQQEPSAPEATSGAGELVVFKPTTSEGETNGDNADPTSPGTSFSSGESANDGEAQSVQQSSIETSGNGSLREPTPTLPTNSIIYGGGGGGYSGGSVFVPTGATVPVSVPQPVGFAPPVIQLPPDPLLQLEDGCTCPNPW